MKKDQKALSPEVSFRKKGVHGLPLGQPNMHLALVVAASLLVTSLDAQACIYKGEKFNNGDTWVARSTFVLRCEVTKAGWKANVIGCKTQNGVVVAPGQTVHEGNTKYECVAAANGRVEIRRTLEVNGRAKTCGTHALGDSWIAEKNFMETCTPSGVKVLNCLSDAGIAIPLNGSLVLSGVTYNCIQQPNGTVTIRRDVTPTTVQSRTTTLSPVEEFGPMYKKNPTLGDIVDKSGKNKVEVTASTQVSEMGGGNDITCNFDGETHRVGEIWVADKIFTKKCTDEGATVILNCIIDEKTILNVDNEITIGKKIYKCYRKKEESRVYYEVRNI
ncbi:unnamed protein product [Caenorhabditis auriculariae]|uniref:Abnormal cell migration protein 18-like fibronectin type I domain-containing protein n=1 Tax=Caenorhabditis auriculariae TaxID=2777116 RepID=A0A8S1HWN3_9PELO|nr:unnamed protein product [Caenorhabditis auriculariae]